MPLWLRTNPHFGAPLLHFPMCALHYKESISLNLRFAIADVTSSLPSGTSWVVTHATQIFPLWTLENTKYSCYMSFILPHHVDVSATISLMGPITLYHVAHWGREKKACLPLFFHWFPFLNVFSPLGALTLTYRNSWYRSILELSPRWHTNSQICDMSCAVVIVDHQFTPNFWFVWNLMCNAPIRHAAMNCDRQ